MTQGKTKEFLAKTTQLACLMFTSGPTWVTTAQQELFITNPPYPAENREMLELISCWNVCASQALTPLQPNLHSLREGEKEMGCIQKLSKALCELWRILVDQIARESQQKCSATLLPPFQDRSPKLPSNPNREWPSWKGHAISFPVKKNGLSQFPLWMKM